MARNLIIGFVSFALVLFGALALQPRGRAPAKTAAAQRFQVRGQVRGVDVEGPSVRIQHEAIPNYMAAMTMEFSVTNRSLLRGLQVGDDVGFELVVTQDDSWIAAIQRLSENGATGGAGPREGDHELQRVQVGETVPDFVLTDQNNRAVHLRDFRGKIVLLTFIYTRCPLPNYCPLMSKNFASLQERLEKQFPGKFQLLSVTIDPEFDRPAVLKSYGARFTNDDRTWTFATGSPEQSDAVGALFGLVQERKGGLVNHDLRTALIGPDGRLVHIWKSNVWTPYEAQRRVEDVLGRL